MAGLADPGHGQGRVGRRSGGCAAWALTRCVAAALAAGTITESYARKICYWSDLLPVGYRDLADQNLADAAAGGADLDFLSQMAEEMFSRVSPPDKDDEDDARFNDRFFRLTRLFQGHGRADGDLTPECLAAAHRKSSTPSARRRARRTTGPRGSAATTRWRRRCGCCWRRAACRSGRARPRRCSCT